MMTRVPFAPPGLLLGGLPEAGHAPSAAEEEDGGREEEGEEEGGTANGAPALFPPVPPATTLLSSSRRRRPRVSGGRKHKMEGEPVGGPLPKKRLTEVGVAAGEPPWGGIGVVVEGGVTSPVAVAAPAAPSEGVLLSSGTPVPGPPLLEMPPCEEMEEVLGEPPCEDTARRRLREIEERIIDDEDEDNGDGEGGGEEGENALLAERAGSGLPTLVMSDTLKTGLRRDYEGALTKKIIESMSRPSMELVLWKPLPEFLSERAKPAPLKTYKPAAAERRTPKPEILGAVFCPPASELQQPAEMPTPPLPPPPPLLLYGNADPAAGPSVSVEEEMEL